MPSSAGWREVPCVECGDFVPGIDFGDRCPPCQKRRVRRARVVARRSALGATLLAAAWLLIRPVTSPTGQWAGLIAVPVTYLLVHFIVARFALEVLP